jgi:hypothetical protein
VIELELYVYYATNEYNFEVLEEIRSPGKHGVTPSCDHNARFYPYVPETFRILDRGCHEAGVKTAGEA